MKELKKNCYCVASVNVYTERLTNYPPFNMIKTLSELPLEIALNRNYPRQNSVCFATL
jgi:hypothetical protein